VGLTAEIERCAADYLWSIAAAHCEYAAGGVLSKGFPPPGVVGDRAQWLQTGNATDVA